MGIIYQLPSLVEEQQLRNVVHILDTTLPATASRGVVLYLGKTGNGPPSIEGVEEVVKDNVPEAYHKVFHIPFTSRYVDSRFRLDDQQSDEVLRPFLELTQRIGCHGIIVHTGTNYYHPMAELSANIDQKYKFDALSAKQLKQSKREVYKRLRDIAESYPFFVALENSPLPKNVGSADGDLRKLILNPLITTSTQIKDFVEYAKHISRGLGVCLDTNHYLRMLSAMLFYNHPDPEIRAIFAAVGEKQESLPLLAIAQYLLENERLFLVQFADNTGWHPEKKSLNATAPHINAHQLRLLVDMVKKHSKHVPLSIEVDETDYIKRPKQQKTLEWILSGNETPVSE